jgi:hypothetical protein
MRSFSSEGLLKYQTPLDLSPFKLWSTLPRLKIGGSDSSQPFTTMMTYVVVHNLLKVASFHNADTLVLSL